MGRSSQAKEVLSAETHMGVVTDRKHLSEESQRHLAQLLRVSNVAVDDMIKRQFLATLQVCLQLFCSGYNLATDCILCCLDLWIDVISAERERGCALHDNGDQTKYPGKGFKGQEPGTFGFHDNFN